MVATRFGRVYDDAGGNQLFLTGDREKLSKKTTAHIFHRTDKLMVKL